MESTTRAMKKSVMDILMDSSMDYLSVIAMDKKRGTQMASSSSVLRKDKMKETWINLSMVFSSALSKD